MTILLNNVNADTTSSTFRSAGGAAIAIIRGDDFTGVTVAIQAASASDPNSTTRWMTLMNGSFTGEATFNMTYLPAGLLLRATVSGANAGDNIFVEILQ